MEYYVGATFLSIVIAWVIKKFLGFKKHKALKMFVALLPLTIVSALRYDVGWDYMNYTNGYLDYITYGDLHFDEIGFKAILKFLAVFTSDSMILFATFSVLVATFFSLCFKHYGENQHVLQYILLFFMTRYFFCSMNIMRQALAMVMILYAFHFILNKRTIKNFLKFALVILLAASVHKLALIFIPLGLILPLDFKKIFSNKKVLVGMIIILVILIIFIIRSGYLAYFDTMFGNDSSIAISELLICLLLLILGGINYHKLIKEKQNIVFYNLQILAFVACLASPFIPTPDRIIWYFATVSSIFLIPQIIDCYGKTMSLIPIFMIYLFLGVVVFNQVIASDSYNIIPYQSVIEVNELGTGL